MRSLSSLASLGPDFLNFKRSATINKASRQINSKSESLPLEESEPCFSDIPKLKMFATMKKNDITLEGQMMHKLEDKNGRATSFLKVNTYRLIGKELYVYKINNSDKHKHMHIIVGASLSDVDDELMDSILVYSFEIIFPHDRVK